MLNFLNADASNHVSYENFRRKFGKPLEFVETEKQKYLDSPKNISKKDILRESRFNHLEKNELHHRDLSPSPKGNIGLNISHRRIKIRQIA